MNIKWIGAILIIVGCGGFGFRMAWNYNRTMASLRQLVRALEYMQSDLEYRLTPLAELCKRTAEQLSGSLKTVYLRFARELESQIAPDAAFCMTAALQGVPDLPKATAEYLELLGKSLGQFDLQGQLRGLESLRDMCSSALAEKDAMRPQRVRSYQTLGLCAGAALAILLI